MHQFIRSIIFFFISVLICTIYSGCTLINTKDTYQIVTTEGSKNAEKIIESSENISVDKETKSLLKLYEDINNLGNSSNEKSDKTSIFVKELYQYLSTRSNLEYLEQINRIEVIESTCQGAYIFNLVRYDADPVGIGTLERTWSLLQIINENDIDVYSVYDKSAEFPLCFKIKDDSLKDGQIIAIAGVTNMSRSNSAFVSFWVYDDSNFEKFTNISLLSDYDGDRLFENEYFLEYSGNKIVQIKDNEDDDGIYDIITDDFEIRTAYKDGCVNIVFSKFD